MRAGQKLYSPVWFQSWATLQGLLVRLCFIAVKRQPTNHSTLSGALIDIVELVTRAHYLTLTYIFWVYKKSKAQVLR
jgi:hypothetical protein